MAIYRVQGPDGDIYRFEGPDDATPAQVEQAAAQQFSTPKASQPAPQPQAPQRSMADSLLRQLGLTARAGIQGAVAIPSMIGDAVGLDTSGAVNRLLDRGLPTPENGAERFSNVVAGGMTQPAMLAKLAPSMAARIGTQIASAGAGAGGSEIAKESGAGPMGQLAAGLAGGIGVPIAGAFAGTGARVAGRLAGNLAAPMTQQGRSDIVARTLQGAATDPALAATNINTATRYVPGVNPTTAELAGDTGISALSKNVRNQNPALFADVEGANDAARQAALAKSFGSAADVTAAEQARDQITGQMRNAAFADAKPVNVRPVINTVNAITKSGAGARQEVEKAMSWVKTRLAGETDPERVYAVRQDINDIIAGKMIDPEKASLKLAAGQLKMVKSVLDAQLEKSAPGFRDYLSQYAGRSKAIDALKTGQDIIAKSTNPMTERLSPASFSRQMANRGDEVAGMGAIGSDALSRVNADLKRSVAPSAAMRTPGSDTLQNMVGSDMLQRALGSVPGGVTTRLASKAASFLYSPFEQQTKGLLSQAMIDPKLAEALLARELKKNPDLWRSLLGSAGPIAQGGLLGSIGAQ
jgi:hypothetical protein